MIFFKKICNIKTSFLIYFTNYKKWKIIFVFLKLTIWFIFCSRWVLKFKNWIRLLKSIIKRLLKFLTNHNLPYTKFIRHLWLFNVRLKKKKKPKTPDFMYCYYYYNNCAHVKNSSIPLVEFLSFLSSTAVTSLPRPQPNHSANHKTP